MIQTFKHMAMWTWPDSVYKEDPRQIVDRLQEAHIDIIIPYTCPQRGNRRDLDPATYDQRLHGIIEEGHRQGLKVHACFDEINAYEDMPIYDLQQVRKDGTKAGVLCPANPTVVDYVLQKLKKMLEESDYDGINLEDGYIFNKNTIYDPAHTTGEKFQVVPVCYCDYCRRHAPIEKPEWDDWKRERINDLVAKEAELVRKIKPGLPFSVAARMPYDRAFYEPCRQDVPYYDDWIYWQSRNALMADWAEWLRRRSIDFACPMSYFHSRRMVELETQECRQLFPTASSDIWMGLGLGEFVAEHLGGKNPAMKNGAAEIEAQLQDQIRMGQENVVFFCYQYLLDEHLPVMARFR